MKKGLHLQAFEVEDNGFEPMTFPNAFGTL